MPDHSPAAPPCEAPVLLLIFNRPDTTRRVLHALQQARPTRLYVAADGPRPYRTSDEVLCAETRALVAELVNWPCEVHTLFRAHNLGCGLGPATAIDWFFEHEPEGIILEDDCVPAPAFFPFCQELLSRYRDDARVLHIGGNNFSAEAQRPAPPGADSYYFSGQVNSWGWATWRRAWQHFDYHMQLWPELKRRGLLEQLYPTLLQRRYWLPKLAAVHGSAQPPDIWDYQWHFAVAAQSGLAIVPRVNLVSNIGFGEDATHTLHADDDFADVPAGHLAFPLQHPPALLRDGRRDQRYFREFMLGRLQALATRWLARLLPGAPEPPQPVPAPAPASPSLEPAYPSPL